MTTSRRPSGKHHEQGAPRPARVGCKDYARAALDMDVAGAVEYARSIHAVINSSMQMVPGRST